MNGKIGYYLIACGTSEYKDKEYCNLDSVNTDLKRIVDLFTRNFGYEESLIHLRFNPKADALKKDFADWLQSEERCETDRVIFYYSGHGEYYNNDRHYLLMEDTDAKKIPQTSLATEDLVLPLNNKGVKISQILYIIDTCYSQSGAGDITKFASSVIQQFQPVKGKNIEVHAIAACRAKDTAEQGVFSKELSEILEDGKDWRENKFVHPSELVDKINQNIKEKINQKIYSKNQHAKYNDTGSETSAKFFPILSKNLQTWEENRHKFIENLLSILNSEPEHSLFFVNSFILSRSFVNKNVGNLLEEFVADKPELRENLKEFAMKPVSEEICPLIACSEWCRARFSDNQGNSYNRNLAYKIEEWQDKVIPYREGVDLSKIKQVVKTSFKEFKKRIKKADLRIQVQIAPQKDEENGTGNDTGEFLLNMNLWVKKKNSPLCIFARNEPLQPQRNNNSDSLQKCLERENFLSNLIHKARYSLPDSLTVPEKPKIEFFLPLGLYQESLEKICFKYGRRMKPLGEEYPIFINSFERYFDEDFRAIRDNIYQMKQALSKNNHLNSESYHIGTEPSESDLEMIEETKAIAVWSRCGDKPLTENDINISEWKSLPQTIHKLRQQKKDMEVTLFWDDLYPKPKPSLLDTRVVE